MINEVPEIAHAVEPSELDMRDLKQCVRYTLGHSDEWLFLTVQDKPRKPDEVAMIEVFTDADWAGDTKPMKSTSSVFTRIDGFTIGVNAQLQDTHAQSSVESEFYALGAGCKPRSICDATPRRQEHWHRDKVCPSVHDTSK